MKLFLVCLVCVVLVSCGGDGGGEGDGSAEPCSTVDNGCSAGRCETVETCIDAPRCNPEAATSSSVCYRLTDVIRRSYPDGGRPGKHVEASVQTRVECRVSGSPDPMSVDFDDPGCKTVTMPPVVITEECDPSGECVIVPGPISRLAVAEDIPLSFPSFHLMASSQTLAAGTMIAVGSRSRNARVSSGTKAGALTSRMNVPLTTRSEFDPVVAAVLATPRGALRCFP